MNIKHIYYSVDHNIRTTIEILSMRKQLNKTMFQKNPITYRDLYQWCKLHGLNKILSDLQEAWDRHNFYDQETL